MSRLSLNSRTLPVAGGLALYALLSLISMATMSIGAGILLAGLIYFHGGPGKFMAALFERIRANPKARRFAWISGFFAGACLVSLVAAEIWPLSYGGHFAEIHFFQNAAKIWYFAWPFVLWHALEACDPCERRIVLRAWLGTFLVLAVTAIFQHYTGWPRPLSIPTDLKHFHATLFLGHHLSVASILIFPFFAWLDFPGVRPLYRALGGIAGFVALMFTYSRTLWIALPIGLVFFAMLKLGRRGRIAAVLVLLATAGVASQIPMIQHRFADFGGVYHREDLWEANWNFFKARPLTGVGLRQNEELSGFYLMEKFQRKDVFQGHAHNNFLDVLSTTGILGTVGFLGWWIFLGWILVLEIRGNSAGRLTKNPEFFGRGLLAALLVYQVNGVTQVNFWEGKVQHQLMWMVAWILLWSGQGHGKEQCRES